MYDYEFLMTIALEYKLDLLFKNVYEMNNNKIKIKIVNNYIREFRAQELKEKFKRIISIGEDKQNIKGYFK